MRRYFFKMYLKTSQHGYGMEASIQEGVVHEDIRQLKTDSLKILLGSF